MFLALANQSWVFLALQIRIAILECAESCALESNKRLDHRQMSQNTTCWRTWGGTNHRRSNRDTNNHEWLHVADPLTCARIYWSESGNCNSGKQFGNGFAHSRVFFAKGNFYSTCNEFLDFGTIGNSQNHKCKCSCELSLCLMISSSILMSKSGCTSSIF